MLATNLHFKTPASSRTSHVSRPHPAHGWVIDNHPPLVTKEGWSPLPRRFQGLPLPALTSLLSSLVPSPDAYWSPLPDAPRTPWHCPYLLLFPHFPLCQQPHASHLPDKSLEPSLSYLRGIGGVQGQVPGTPSSHVGSALPCCDLGQVPFSLGPDLPHPLGSHTPYSIILTRRRAAYRGQLRGHRGIQARTVAEACRGLLGTLDMATAWCLAPT